jgi:hypothetical protein
VKILHFGEAKGMRPAINAAAAIARGEYLLKTDGHTMWAPWLRRRAQSRLSRAELGRRASAVRARPGNVDDRRIVRRRAQVPDRLPLPVISVSTPRRSSLRSARHTVERTEDRARGRAPRRRDVLARIRLVHGARALGADRPDLDIANYGNFIHEFQEVGLKTWLGGGAVKVNKKTWYAHLFKGTRYGRGYNTRGMGHEAGTAFTTWFWMTDQPFPGKTRTMRSLIEQFSPVQTWGDLDETFARAAQEFRNPYQVAA